tara:strand:+ start:1266 stop:1709 length:444 start_codon:yes stop_codon:yes gene_type:complete
MYEVGQILYTIIEDKQIVVPVKVIEQVTIKTLDGEETNYKLLLPNNKLQKVDMSKFKNVFKDISVIENKLVEKAKNAIDQMLIDAITLEEKFFTSKEKEVKTSNEETQTCNNEINSVKIDLGDGVIANIDKNNIDQILDQEELQKKT